VYSFISRCLGTADVYAHLTPKMRREPDAVMDRIVGTATG
jgi:hypothetical protein